MAITWQLLDRVDIPAKPAGFWTLAHEFVPGSRLLRIHTLTEAHEARATPVSWSPLTGDNCGPDGAPTKNNKTGLLCSTAAYGALIGKIGGGTADLPDSTPGATTLYPNKRVFAVGTDAIIALPTAADGGPLFLTMNDKPEEFSKHSGVIQVFLEYYPL